MVFLLHEIFHTRRRTEAEVTAQRMEARWHKEGWRACPQCDGAGHIEDMGDKITCFECEGSGQVKTPFHDWLDELEEVEAVRIPVPLVGEVA